MTATKISFIDQLQLPRQAIADANATIGSRVSVAAVRSLTATRTLTLPAASAYQSDLPLTVADETGSCSATISIIVATSGTDTILGLSTIKLTQPYQRLNLYSDGNGKWTLAGLPDEVVTSFVNSGPLATALAGKIASSRKITAGTGLTGGGDLSADRSLAITANGVDNTLLAQMPATTLKANTSAGAANASDVTLSALLDALVGSTRGNLLYRGSTGWSALALGASGTVLQSNGTDLAFATPSSSSSTASPTFTGTTTLQDASAPYLRFRNTGAGTDLKTFDIYTDTNGNLYFRTVNDALNSAASILTIARSGAVPTGLSFALRPTFNGNTAWDSGNLAATSLLPAGQVAPFAMAAPPAGWLKCNGAAISRTTYSGLFTAIGTTWGTGDGSTTFNVPDFRGYFLRGLDDGRGVDSSRTLASAQADLLAAHGHNFIFNGNVIGSIYSSPNPSSSYTPNLVQGDASNYYQFYIQSSGGAETRPKNIAVPFFIKF